MLRNIVFFTLLHLIVLSHANADEDISNFTDLMPMALTGIPYVVDSNGICPPDSELASHVCRCNVDLCEPPPCDKFSYIVRNGTDTPGNCCPLYACDDCAETLSNCTCNSYGEDVFLNSKGDCECVDPHKSLINGSCACDTSKCELPLLCDGNSVPIKQQDGCCTTIICRPCPPDSYSTQYPNEKIDEAEIIEDICVCYPCPKTQCNETHVPDTVKKGINFPGECCDLYECIPRSTCIRDGVAYNDGQFWITEDKQNCTCIGGVSVCDEPRTTDVLVKHCFHNDTYYSHLSSWTEDTCTNCTCYDGVPKCIAHLCNVSESRITKYEECLHDNHSYQHLESWLTHDCMNCTCYNGFEKCEHHLCNISIPIDIRKYNCPSLDNCKRYCKHGYKTNRRGCEICKCKILEAVVEKYPLLEMYMKEHNLSENDTLYLLRKKDIGKERQVENVTPPSKASILLSLFCIISFCAGIGCGYVATLCCKKKCTYDYSTVSKPMDNNNIATQGDIHPYISEKSPLKT